MLKLSAKRSYDSMDTCPPSQCSPHRIQFLDSSPMKRIKIAKTSPPSSPSSTTSAVKTDYFVAPPADTTALVTNNAPRKQKVLNGEVVFTESEVKSIVEKAVTEREAAIKLEFERILQDLLQEQFNNFSKFHQDYVSRQIKDSDFSYMS
eukprot:TRINITY_DN350_c0_g1_i1.p1 TRINITY_DN350_c0_g1~~TRINITY_DN350_c0_g1_i1.p1  ORF type:complete len:149 (-),score=29.13 TRINITY_DN350_c0_g1_i1:237-683(-)